MKLPEGLIIKKLGNLDVIWCVNCSRWMRPEELGQGQGKWGKIVHDSSCRTIDLQPEGATEQKTRRKASKSANHSAQVRQGTLEDWDV